MRLSSYQLSFLLKSLVTVTVTGTATPASTDAVTVSVGGTTTAAATPTAAPGAIGDFGSCTVPQIEFGPGFDGRRETSFQPADKSQCFLPYSRFFSDHSSESFNHGSAQNINIITQFICDTLVNSCGADQTAQATCATASSAVDTAAKGSGGQADAFNAVFGITTDFAADPVIDNLGSTIAGGNAVASTTAAVAASSSVAAVTTAVVSYSDRARCIREVHKVVC